MKLKTLKEIFSGNENELFVRRDHLKEEVIKWVKKDMFHGFNAGEGIKIIMTSNAKDFFKIFFNITEEELK